MGAVIQALEMAWCTPCGASILPGRGSAQTRVCSGNLGVKLVPFTIHMIVVLEKGCHLVEY